MRKTFATIALAFTLVLGGCAGFDNAVKFATIGVDNPITKKELAIINQSYLTLLRPTVAYLEMRTCQPTEDELRSWATARPCGNYDRKIVVHDALGKARMYRLQLKQFVNENRTIDAQVAYSEFQKALTIMRTVPKRGA